MKKLTRDEMKNVVGGKNAPAGECSANCNPGFVTITCSGTCTATTDVGVKCGDGTEKKC